ncbi:glycoside hydrolase family 128 protein [Collybiopsis luxurians FD-317 M1]|uniref:Glycoside hydrolase family 128 protein n=1 Tax=Collybiopsis luxurians FD-317 M1 TaxID=944289 RepID=A0A0D0AY68_9AGAR|nr:glycoside hydrolase family 128 protein [Collybiopsis luxurians FD-317 M1]
MVFQLKASFSALLLAITLFGTLSSFTVVDAAPIHPGPRSASTSVQVHPAHLRRGVNAKRGIAYETSSKPDPSHIANTAISWLYNWGDTAPANLPKGIEFVPMQWGKDGVDGFQAKVKASGAKYVLGFNEPERPDQSNIPVADAVTLFKQYLTPLRSQGIKVGAPAVSSAPEGQAWIKAFAQQCTDCFDFIPLHWYGTGSANFLGYLDTMHKATELAKYQLWVTEFGDTTMNDPTTVKNFLTDTIKSMDGLSYVDRYSWFDYSTSTPGLQTNLLDPKTGGLNDLGTAYVA